MPESPDDSTIVIVDPLPLRTVGLAAILDRLTDGKGTRVASLTPDEAERLIGSDKPCGMIIYNVGGASLADHRHCRRIKSLRAHGRGAPLVIFSDSDRREEVVAAFTVGAQGYLYAGTNPQLALQALSFIFKGGSYFPPSGQARHRRSCKVEASTTEGVHRLRHGRPAVDPALDGDGHHATARAGNTAANGLTERQRAVLALLGHGDTNKAIARRLNIREGTVKVHVRQIMRKMGAANRTQVAIAANGDGGGLKGR